MTLKQFIKGKRITPNIYQISLPDDREVLYTAYLNLEDIIRIYGDYEILTTAFRGLVFHLVPHSTRRQLINMTEFELLADFIQSVGLSKSEACRIIYQRYDISPLIVNEAVYYERGL